MKGKKEMKRRKTHLQVGAIITSLGLILAGCSSASDTSSTTTEDTDSVTEEAKEPVSLTLGAPGEPPVFINTVLYVAQAQGFFEEEGLEVSLRPFPTGSDVARAVQSGEIEGGLIATPGAVALRANGGDISAIYGFENPSYVIGTTNLSIESCEDLAGQTIAVDAEGAPKDVALTDMLSSCGLSPSDVSTIAPGGPQSVDAMLANQVELAVLHPDELSVVSQSLETDVVMTLAGAKPLSHYTAIVTTDGQIDGGETREDWVNVVRALKKAIAFIYEPANADLVAQVASDMTTRSVEVTRGALDDFLAIEFWPIEGVGLSPDRINATIQQQVDIGNVEANDAPTFEELTDVSLFEDAN